MYFTCGDVSEIDELPAWATTGDGKSRLKLKLALLEAICELVGA